MYLEDNYDDDEVTRYILKMILMMMGDKIYLEDYYDDDEVTRYMVKIICDDWQLVSR